MKAACQICGTEARFDSIEEATDQGWSKLENKDGESLYYCPRHSKSETIVSDAFTK